MAAEFGEPQGCVACRGASWLRGRKDCITVHRIWVPRLLEGPSAGQGPIPIVRSYALYPTPGRVLVLSEEEEKGQGGWRSKARVRVLLRLLGRVRVVGMAPDWPLCGHWRRLPSCSASHGRVGQTEAACACGLISELHCFVQAAHVVGDLSIQTPDKTPEAHAFLNPLLQF